MPLPDHHLKGFEPGPRGRQLGDAIGSECASGHGRAVDDVLGIGVGLGRALDRDEARAPVGRVVQGPEPFDDPGDETLLDEVGDHRVVG